MKEEDNMLKKVGTENAFRVPEGYFENFTSELMNRLPEKEKLAFEQKEPTMWERVKPWAYMAAMFVGAALIIRVASSDRTPAATDRMAATKRKPKWNISTWRWITPCLTTTHCMYIWPIPMPNKP